MSRKDRTGKRKSRDQRMIKRVPEMGYYLIITDTEATERYFFNGLRDSLPKDIKDKLVIKVVETRTRNMIQKCLELAAYHAQYCIPWIIFDRDQVIDFDDIISKAKREGIQVGWSNPCFEIWMYAYFGSMPVIQDSWTCCERFADIYEKQTGQKYSKSDAQLYHRLTTNGDEDKALTIAQRKYNQCKRNGFTNPSKMLPCTTVHELVREIRIKVKETEGDT